MWREKQPFGMTHIRDKINKIMTTSMLHIIWCKTAKNGLLKIKQKAL